MHLGDLTNVAILFVVSAVVMSIGAYVLSSIQSNLGASSMAVNNTLSNATAGLNTLASWFPTLAIVIAASIIIGTIISALVIQRREG